MRSKRIVCALSIMLLGGQQALAQPQTGIDFSHFDHSVRLQDDMFSAVNGQWLKTTAIPPDKAGYGTFIELRDRSEERSRALIESAAANPAAGTDNAKIGALYHSYMDEALLEKRGLEPLAPSLARIRAIATQADLASYLGAAQIEGENLALNVNIDQDPGDSTHYLPNLAQGGLGMPDRDYYLDGDARFKSIRAAYRLYLARLLTLAGESAAEPRADAVAALETRIAAAQWSRAANRDPRKTYNPLTRDELASRFPGIDWGRYLQGARLNAATRFTIAQPDYVANLSTLLATVPLDVWRDYLTLRRLDRAAPLLTHAFCDAHFAFHQTALNGTQSQVARWKRGVAIVNAAMGEAVGKLYVARYFPAADKERMQKLVSRLLEAYRDSIAQLDWMTEQTKVQAQAKLARYSIKIGYPDKWRDYSALEIKAGDLYGNVERAARFDYLYRLARLNGPVDREEWDMTPQTVNAYYNAQRNEIVFPAAILQPPFFNRDADDAVNYGAIGSVIGHEISHGFDDEGSQFDGQGNLHDWWNDVDRARFKALTQRMVAQYAAYQPLPGKTINGELTLGENIADNAGLQIAYKAYQRSLEGTPAPRLANLSGEQRFFIGFAQLWRYKVRDAALLQMLVRDPHSPARYRVNGAVVNSDAFYSAFDLKPGDKLYRPSEERIRLW
ncbi:M13 family metallopeptidase [Paludibacterium yongneupense]|uniref:M13 family metallopeptidase n=1 Tax=Paludibacterium yongneupense TaxID=400061 RepID=UPI000427203E|nr:M13 family metallopeptidase [Paludibacterium yongneupense]